MLIISFAWTTPALLAGAKTCTRRDWSNNYAKLFKKGQLVAAYDKSPRIGGKHIATIRLTHDPYQQLTCDTPQADWEREGFAYLTSIGAKCGALTPLQLWETWMTTAEELWVIRFQLVAVTGEKEIHQKKSHQNPLTRG